MPVVAYALAAVHPDGQVTTHTSENVKKASSRIISPAVRARLMRAASREAGEHHNANSV